MSKINREDIDPEVIREHERELEEKLKSMEEEQGLTVEEMSEEEKGKVLGFIQDVYELKVRMTQDLPGHEDYKEAFKRLCEVEMWFTHRLIRYVRDGENF